MTPDMIQYLIYAGIAAAGFLLRHKWPGLGEFLPAVLGPSPLPAPAPTPTPAPAPAPVPTVPPDLVAVLAELAPFVKAWLARATKQMAQQQPTEQPAAPK